MKKHLYFICPTDSLESLINHSFDQENYFLTSLGNSMAFDPEKVDQLVELLTTEGIKDITFILSDNNEIVLDALGPKNFSGFGGLKALYNSIATEKRVCEEVWQNGDRHFLILSYYLNGKVNDLRMELDENALDPIHINAKIFKREYETFVDTYPQVVLKDSFALN